MFLKRLMSNGLTSTRRKAEGLAAMFMQHLARLPYQIASVQYNLYDSHDISRLHNNPDISYESRRAAIIMQFTFPGTPSIYYGDETSLDGHITTVEGCRYPMKWDSDDQDQDCLQLHNTLAHLKREEEALRSGGFKILYALDYVISYARFTDEKAFIAVCSQEQNAVCVKIPVVLVGIYGNPGIREIFGRSAACHMEDGMMVVELKAQESLLFEVKMQG